MTMVRASELRDDLCLALANTLDWRGSGQPVEELVDGTALRAWAEREGIGALAPRRPELRPALELRETLHAVLSAIARGDRPPRRDVRALEEAVRDAAAHARFSRTGAVFDYTWEADDTVETLLRPVAWSAAEVLRSVDALTRLRVCDDEACGWLFLDRSRSRTRRWCAMRACGNRAKARRHYARTRAGV